MGLLMYSSLMGPLWEKSTTSRFPATVRSQTMGGALPLPVTVLW